MKGSNHLHVAHQRQLDRDQCSGQCLTAFHMAIGMAVQLLCCSPIVGHGFGCMITDTRSVGAVPVGIVAEQLWDRPSRLIVQQTISVGMHHAEDLLESYAT